METGIEPEEAALPMGGRVGRKEGRKGGREEGQNGGLIGMFTAAVLGVYIPERSLGPAGVPDGVLR